MRNKLYMVCCCYDGIILVVSFWYIIKTNRIFPHYEWITYIIHCGYYMYPSYPILFSLSWQIYIVSSVFFSFIGESNGLVLWKSGIKSSRSSSNCQSILIPIPTITIQTTTEDILVQIPGFVLVAIAEQLYDTYTVLIRGKRQQYWVALPPPKKKNLGLTWKWEYSSLDFFRSSHRANLFC